MEFHNKVSDYAKVSKKGNMAYWDEIDGVSEDYVRSIIEFSTKELKIPDFMDKDDVILEVGKEVTGCIVEYLEKHFGAEFPFVDENY